MDNERLANLALLHTHYDQQIDIDMVIDMYAQVQMHARRIELKTLLVCNQFIYKFAWIKKYSKIILCM